MCYLGVRNIYYELNSTTLASLTQIAIITVYA